MKNPINKGQNIKIFLNKFLLNRLHLMTLSYDKELSRNPKPHDFEINYDVPLEFSSNSEIALIGFNIWCSWYNFSDKYNTNKLKYFDGKEWKIIIFGKW